MSPHPQRVKMALAKPSPTTMMLGVFAAVLGLSILIGHGQAWVGPEYTGARKVPGAPESWGLILLAAGLGVIVSKRLLKHTVWPLLLSLFVSGVWFMSFGMTLLSTFLWDQGVGLTPAITNIFVASLFLFRCAIYYSGTAGVD